MTSEQFEATLLRFLHQEPFKPFVVELLDGRVIEINRPGLALGGDSASFLTPNYDLVEFACEEVRDIRQAAQGVAS